VLSTSAARFRLFARWFPFAGAAPLENKRKRIDNMAKSQKEPVALLRSSERNAKATPEQKLEQANSGNAAPTTTATPTPITRREDATTQQALSSLRIPLNPDGTVAIDRMRDKTRKEIVDALNRPDVQQALGLASSTAMQPVGFQFDPKLTYPLYDALGKVEALCARIALKIEPDIAAAVFTYDEKQKEALAEPTAKVIGKHAPEWLRKYPEEFALLVVFSAIMTEKFDKAMTMQQHRDVVRKQQAAEATAAANVAAKAATA
jgi:hypothetical protein